MFVSVLCFAVNCCLACVVRDLLHEWHVHALRVLHIRQGCLLVVNGLVLVCAETFMQGLSACIFDIHQPDVEALKAHLTRDGRSDADIVALPSKYLRDRYRFGLQEYIAHTAVSYFVPTTCCTYSSVMFLHDKDSLSDLPEYGFGNGQHCLITYDACHLSNDDMVLDCILKHCCLQYAFASAFVRFRN